MDNSAGDSLRKTVLNGWHRANGAKMVGFEGWEMPVHYANGIIAEHLATRRTAGLFDISHMGRFLFRGPGAETFLLHALTNNAQALEAGEAQYTFIATETGGAVDDAYLYRYPDDVFLLVVNAGNRDKDWAWLQQLRVDPLVVESTDAFTLHDASDDLAMLSLQGPGATEVLEHVVAPHELPENKRNQLTVVEIDGTPLTIARTGYTGESVCFELFVPSDAACALWGRLVDAGGTPVGLGARDSLRLEAGLPLYGHELGKARDGSEIPVFANGLANFAVRVKASHQYVGRQALERQRARFEAICRNDIDPEDTDRTLTHLIQPIAVFSGRRPLRAGHTVYEGEREVGYVTSGTSVPYAQFHGDGISAEPGQEHALRPIGLALLDSGLRFRAERPVILRVVDERGRTQEAELVERNLAPAGLYGRVYRGFEPPKVSAPINTANVPRLAAGLEANAGRNTIWRRTECINLIPSEQPTSAFVDRLCTADPAGRYNEHNHIRALGVNAPDVRYYKGTAFIMGQEEALKAALREFFNCTRVEPRIISGQMANDVVYDALKQFRNRFRRARVPELLTPVLVHDLNKGGHLSAQVPGALKNYVGLDPVSERPSVIHFPISAEQPHRIDADATKALIARHRPVLIVFGRSVIIHREPVAEIADFVHREFGSDNPERPLILYDGAHVLGLLGDAFQDPLKEGADVVTGSTHKTFFGPQRGVILSNIEPGSVFDPLWNHIESRAFPGHVSNHHLGTLLGLLGATYEMLEHRKNYPQQVVANAKALAGALHRAGLVVEGDPALGFTETHQVLLRGARASGEHLANVLEANNIITNPQAFYDDPNFAAASGIRMGTQEMTRYGMREADFAGLGAALAEILTEHSHSPSGHWTGRVKTLRSRFIEMRYCFA